MKELSIEDKAKRYDEAIKKGKQIQNTPYTAHWDIMKEVAEYLLPELKESEDEKAFKEILQELKDSEDSIILTPLKRERWISCLEKQGEQFHANSAQTCKDEQKLTDKVGPKFKVGDTIQPKDRGHKPWQIMQVDIVDKKYRFKDGYVIHFSQEDDYELVKQKPDDKVEPKFHEGDWVVENEPNNYARFIQILEIVNVQGKDRYRISRDIHNDEDIVEFDFVEKYYHKFDIKDAKDGDVLSYNDGSLTIFRYRLSGLDAGLYMSHVVLTDKTEFKQTCAINNVHPATKEQRDTLEKAMTNAGYRWDKEKLKLEKI